MDRPGTIASMPSILARGRALAALIERKDVSVGPVRKTGFGPSLEIRGGRSHRHARIHSRGPAQDLASGDGVRLPPKVRLGRIAPVMRRIPPDQGLQAHSI